MSLLQALGQMTLLPARRLQNFCPGMAKKGRMQVGADADITVFDPSTVRDCATWTEPALKSAGIVHVIVNGQCVVSDGSFQPGVLAGRPIRGGRGGVDGRATKRPRTAGLYASILEGQDSSFLASPTNSL
jgi:dihydroorotase